VNSTYPLRDGPETTQRGTLSKPPFFHKRDVKGSVYSPLPLFFLLAYAAKNKITHVSFFSLPFQAKKKIAMAEKSTDSFYINLGKGHRVVDKNNPIGLHVGGEGLTKAVPNLDSFDQDIPERFSKMTTTTTTANGTAAKQTPVQSFKKTLLSANKPAPPQVKINTGPKPTTVAKPQPTPTASSSSKKAPPPPATVVEDDVEDSNDAVSGEENQEQVEGQTVVEDDQSDSDEVVEDEIANGKVTANHVAGTVQQGDEEADEDAEGDEGGEGVEEEEDEDAKEDLEEEDDAPPPPPSKQRHAGGGGKRFSKTAPVSFVTESKESNRFTVVETGPMWPYPAPKNTSMIGTTLSHDQKGDLPGGKNYEVVWQGNELPVRTPSGVPITSLYGPHMIWFIKEVDQDAAPIPVFYRGGKFKALANQQGSKFFSFFKRPGGPFPEKNEVWATIHDAQTGEDEPLVLPYTWSDAAWNKKGRKAKSGGRSSKGGGGGDVASDDEGKSTGEEKPASESKKRKSSSKSKKLTVVEENGVLIADDDSEDDSHFDQPMPGEVLTKDGNLDFVADDEAPANEDDEDESEDDDYEQTKEGVSSDESGDEAEDRKDAPDAEGDAQGGSEEDAEDVAAEEVAPKKAERSVPNAGKYVSQIPSTIQSVLDSTKPAKASSKEKPARSASAEKKRDPSPKKVLPPPPPPVEDAVVQKPSSKSKVRPPPAPEANGAAEHQQPPSKKSRKTEAVAKHVPVASVAVTAAPTPTPLDKKKKNDETAKAVTASTPVAKQNGGTKRPAVALAFSLDDDDEEEEEAKKKKEREDAEKAVAAAAVAPAVYHKDIIKALKEASGYESDANKFFQALGHDNIPLTEADDSAAFWEGIIGVISANKAPPNRVSKIKSPSTLSAEDKSMMQVAASLVFHYCGDLIRSRTKIDELIAQHDVVETATQENAAPTTTTHKAKRQRK
jgi:hypothetical protein